jgi:cytochrome c-type biogenesis protein
MRSGEHATTARVLMPAIVFCLSFTAMFVALGMTATGIGSALNDNRELLDKLAGGFIVAMGIFFVLTPFVPVLNKEWRPDGLIARAGSGGPLIAGAAFAVAWTPCIGPTLSAILAAAATSDSVGHGGVLLAFYSAGLAIPFLITAVLFERATEAWRWLRDHYLVVTAVSGVVLILMGTLMFTGEITQLNSRAQDLLGNLGLDFIYRL